MSPTIALLAALTVAPGQTGNLNLGNVRYTYRDLGPVRTNTKFLPGDVVHVAFDIENLKMADDGKVRYSMGMEVLDKVGKAIFTAPAEKYEMLLPLGGNKLPAHVFVGVDPGMQAGNYTCKVTIADSSNNATKTIEQKFEVVPMTFGLVSTYVSYDERAQMPSGMAGVAGQTVFVNFGMVGFGRDASKKPNATVEIRILDESGRATVAKPITIDLPKDLPEKDQFVPCQVRVALNREGNFTVEMKAVDKITNKTANLSFPLKVYPAIK